MSLNSAGPIPAMLFLSVTGASSDRKDGGFLWLLETSVTPTQVMIALAGFGLFLASYDANSYAALLEVIPPRYRASTNALMSTSGFILAAGAPRPATEEALGKYQEVG